MMRREKWAAYFTFPFMKFFFFTDGMKIMREILMTVLYFWKRDLNPGALNMKYIS